MSESRVADLLQARVARTLRGALAAYAVALIAIFGVAGEVVLRRSLERSAGVVESLLGLYADPEGERTSVAPAMLADQLLGVGDAFLITRTITRGQGRSTVYFLTADMPAKSVSPGATREAIREQLIAAIAERGRWRYRLLHRRAGEFDVFVAGSRGPYLLGLAGGAGVALVLLPLAALLARRAAARGVAATLAPLDTVVSETRRIAPQDLSQRISTPTGVAEVTMLADTINQLVDRVERSHRALEAFTADASHELRTPLTHLRAQVQWALAEHRGLDEMREAVAAIAHEVDATIPMVEDLLLIARGENRQLALARDPFDVTEVVREVGEIAQAMAGARSLAVRAAVNGPVRALGDATRTRQILLNLASNAVRYTSTGTVTLEIQHDGDRVGIVVRDTGTGIAPEHLPRIFDRFYRVEPSRARSRGGAGLGLTIARLLAELQDGCIDVASRLGEGSAFTLWLPATD